MNHNNNQDQEPKKPSEEEIQAIIEALKNQKKQRKIGISLGFLLHRNYMIHMVLSLLINFIISAVVIGLAIGLNQPLVYLNVPGYITAILLLTMLENFVKLLLFKYFTRIMILSMGILSVFVQIIILFIIDMFLSAEFGFIHTEYLFIFAFSFSILRVILSSYLRRWFYDEHITFINRR
jgi:ABC-type multidrug transport system fused ATPase/permease subunit